MAKLTFHGAAGTVTGSKTLLEANGESLLIDCGMFQGLKALRELNWAAPGFDARALPCVALTHAHIDHSGWLPRLCKSGFHGRILATPATAELAKLLLLDSAHLQEEDADFLNRKGATKHKPALPLYDELDVRRVLERFEVVPYETWKTVSPRIAFRFISVGHLLGSAMIEVRVAGSQTILFSGDVGRYNVPLAPDPLPPAPCDALIMESTYGNRSHGEIDLYEELAKIAERTFARNGVLLVPAFAVGRSQQVIYMLRELYECGRIARAPIHVDSPMAVDATYIYSKYRAELDPLVCAKTSAGYLGGPDVTFHRSREQSKKLNNFEGPGVIISSSGMLTGGRILHHLVSRLPDARNTVLLVGYQAEGTRGRALSEGAHYLRFHGEQVEVRAEIAALHGMSGHADPSELFRWTAGLEPPKRVFLTHGEPEAAESLAKQLHDQRGWNTTVPALHQSFDL